MNYFLVRNNKQIIWLNCFAMLPSVSFPESIEILLTMGSWDGDRSSSWGIFTGLTLFVVVRSRWSNIRTRTDNSNRFYITVIPNLYAPPVPRIYAHWRITRVLPKNIFTIFSQIFVGKNNFPDKKIRPCLNIRFKRFPKSTFNIREVKRYLRGWRIWCSN